MLAPQQAAPAGLFVQGCAITLAAAGLADHALIHTADHGLSRWALDLLNTVDALHVAMAQDLLAELAEKDAELVAVVGQRPDDLSRIPGGLVVVFDRPTSPGNIGTLIRSADAFGATGMVVTGHAADIYDPKAVRASTGSLLTLPVVRFDGSEVASWGHAFGAGFLAAEIPIPVLASGGSR